MTGLKDEGGTMTEGATLHIRTPSSKTTRVVPLPGRSVRVGRGPQCEVRLADDDLDDVQCVLRRRGERWLAQAVGRKGMVRVDGRLLEGQRPLAFGCTIRIGASWLSLVPSDGAGLVDHDESDVYLVEDRESDEVGVDRPVERPKWHEHLSGGTWHERWVEQRQKELAWESRWRSVGASLHSVGAKRPTKRRGTEGSVATRPSLPIAPSAWVDRSVGLGVKEVPRPVGQGGVHPTIARTDEKPSRESEPAPEDRSIVSLPEMTGEQGGEWSLVAIEAKALPIEPHLHRDGEAPAEPLPPRECPAPAQPAQPPEPPTPILLALPSPGPAPATDDPATADEPKVLEPATVELPGGLEILGLDRLVSVLSGAAFDGCRPDPLDALLQGPAIAWPQEEEGPRAFFQSSRRAGILSEPEASAKDLPGTAAASRVSEPEASAKDLPGTAAPSRPEVVPEVCVNRHNSVESEATDPRCMEAEGEPARLVIDATQIPEALTEPDPASPTQPEPLVSHRPEPDQPGPTAGNGRRESGWPTVQAILAARVNRCDRAVDGATPVPRRWSRRWPQPTAPARPTSWRVPGATWLCVPAAAASLMGGMAAVGLALKWAAGDRAGGALADRVATAGAGNDEARRLAAEWEAALPDPTWTNATGDQIGVRVAAATFDPTGGSRLAMLLDAGRSTSPAERGPRLARAWRDAQAATTPALGSRLGLSRDSIAMSWSARQLMDAGRTDEALALYRRALEGLGRLPSASADRPTAPTDAGTRRFEMPHEARCVQILRDMIESNGGAREHWERVVPESSLVALAAAKALGSRGGGEADRALDLAASWANRPAPTGFDPNLHVAAGAEALAIQGRFDEAAKRYRVAIDGLPRSADGPRSFVHRSWAFNLADVCTRGNDGAGARAARTEALDRAPGDEITTLVVQAQMRDGDSRRSDAGRIAADRRGDDDRR